MIRGAIRVLSPPGPDAKLSILIFHRVLSERDELVPGEFTAPEFDLVCSWLKQWFNLLPLAEAIARLGTNSLPARAACITFDDGYADNRINAAPILNRHALPATFFIATGFLDGGRMWNDTVIECLRRTPNLVLPAQTLNLPGLDDIPLEGLEQRRSAVLMLLPALKHLPFERRSELVERLVDWAQCPLPDDLMMTREQVRELAAMGLHIGAHTVNHPILRVLPEALARQEMAQSRDDLQALLGVRVGLFAYPNGRPGQDYAEREVRLARELGFDAAVSTAWGFSTSASNLHELRRFTPWDRSRGMFGLRLARNLLTA